MSIALEKCKNNAVLNYSGTRFFPLKVEIAQFPDGFRLKTFYTLLTRRISALRNVTRNYD